MKKKYHISLEKMWQFFLVCAVTLKAITREDCLLLPKGEKIAKLLHL